MSTPIIVTVSDLCLKTEYILEDGDQVIEIEMSVLGPAVTAIFSKPVSVLEVEMNFPEICGDINYELIYVSGPTGNGFSPTLD